MNINKICAAVSALCLSATAVLLAGNAHRNTSTFADALKFGDIDGNNIIDARDATLLLSYYAYTSTHDQISLEDYIIMQRGNTTTQTTTSPPTADPSVKLKSGGDKFTIAVWNMDDVPRIVSTWLNIPEEDFMSYNQYGYGRDKLRDPDIINNVNDAVFKTPSGAELNIINFGVSSGDVSDMYDDIFLSGYDIDLFYCEPSWMNKYINYDNLTAPLSDLGFTDEDFAQTYSYTDELGHNKNGVRKAVAPFICPGAFAYRTDLAKTYLGINSPTEMQNAIGSWDDFVSTAKKLSGNTYGTIALSATYGGVFQAYASEHKLVNEDGSVTADAKTFADHAKELWDCGGITKNNQWTDEWIDDCKNGKLIGYFVPTWGVNGFLTDAAENSEGKWDIVPGPETFYWGGMWTVVNSATDNGSDCASFIRSSCINTDSMLKSAAADEDYLPNNKAAMAEILADPTKSKLTENKVFSNNNLLGVFSANAEKLVPYIYTFEKEYDHNLTLQEVIEKEYFRYKNPWDEVAKSFYYFRD